MERKVVPDPDTFSHVIRALDQRAENLQRQAKSSPLAEEDLLAQTLVELQVSLEELHVAEEELRQQNEELILSRQNVEVERQRYRDLFEFAPDAYIVLDPAGIIQEANRAAGQLFGVRQRELEGKPLVLYLVREGYSSFYSLLQKVSGEAGIHAWDTTVRPRGGGLVPVSVNAEQRCNREGRVEGVQLLMRDITPQLETQKRLRELNAGLEARVRQRTADLQRSNDELQQFAYVVSHDLQEPLRVIGSYVQLLAEQYRGQLDSEADEIIGYAVDGAARMQHLISELLRYSRVGTQDYALRETSCEEVLARVMQVLEIAVEDSNATITHDPLPTVYADPVQLGQVWQNLLSNAIKYHGHEPPRIHVAVQRRGGEWVFSLQDNGIGLDPKHAERIFVIFQRLHTQSEYPGTGVGLAICKKIINRHGGRIWVESEPGKGSTFYFTLPTKEMKNEELKMKN